MFGESPSSDLLLLGAGQCFFKKTTGVANPVFKHMGNVETFELTTADEKKQKFSSMSRGRPLYKSVTSRRVVTARLGADEFSLQNMLLAFMGSTVDYTQAATAVTDEILAADVVLGGYYQLAKKGPYTSVTFEKDDTVDVVLDQGIDWEWINEDAGMIRILPDAVKIDNGDQLQANYTPTAYTTGTLEQISGGSEAVIEGAFRYISDNASGPQTQVDLWKVSVSPDGAIGLISEDFAQMGLSLEVLDDTVNHPTAPLFLVSPIPTA